MGTEDILVSQYRQQIRKIARTSNSLEKQICIALASSLADLIYRSNQAKLTDVEKEELEVKSVFSEMTGLNCA